MILTDHVTCLTGSVFDSEKEAATAHYEKKQSSKSVTKPIQAN